VEGEKMELEEMQVNEEQELEHEVHEPAEEHLFTEEKAEVDEKQQKDMTESIEGDRGSFIHGLSVGLGMGCIATFIIMWIVVFFSPKLPSTITYESLLSIFIYPLLYLLAIGLVALTAGIVREYYARK
jgi:hypothetical protein